MKLVGAIGTAVLSLSLGAGIPAYAQQEQHDQQEENKDKPAQEKEKKAQPEKAAKQEQKNARQEDKNIKPEEKNAQQEKNNNKEEKNTQEQHAQESKPGKQEEHARGNGGAGRIPDDRYRANFGRDHRFRVSQAEYSNRRFQYGGYWFGFAGAWPSNWLYTEDVYVVEIDGVYYLCNANYPGVNITLNITL